SAALVAKDSELPEVRPDPAPGGHPYLDREELQDIYRSWRRIADSYGPDRVLIGELWLPDAERFARYLRPDVLHTAFNFDFLSAPWQAAALRESIVRTLEVHDRVGAPPTWVLSNHDVTRPATRYGRADSSFAFERKRYGVPTDLELGTRRARAASLLAMALPGSFYLYQGEELGLPEVEVPRDRIEDPMHFRSGGVDPGRDGCRVPIPWSGEAPPYGFSPVEVDTWLPQPDDWGRYAADRQAGDPDSMLTLYRAGLRLRHEVADLTSAPLSWLDLGDQVIAFRRGSFASVTNLSDSAVDLPAPARIRLASTTVEGGRLPADATAWLELA
ncbi:MAG TPA: alpha-amylase family glycosyl hydrolase, partial [Nocardioides sp.]|nr:alpha-amylase family glycosyl hydrolase [Nocardioides sp.]